MHAKKNTFKINHRAAAIYSLALTALLIIVGGSLYLGAHTKASTKSAEETVQSVQQPPTAAQIASEEKCVNFTDKMTPGGDAAVLDVGNCYIGSVKYAINTFASPASRDAWIKAAEPFGVNPKWETATSVTYPSVSDS